MSSMATTAQNSMFINRSKRSYFTIIEHLKHKSLAVDTERDTSHMNPRIQLPKFTAEENSNTQVHPQHSSTFYKKNIGSLVQKERKEILTPRTAMSIRHSIMSGIED